MVKLSLALFGAAAGAAHFDADMYGGGETCCSRGKILLCASKINCALALEEGNNDDDNDGADDDPVVVWYV